MNSIKYLTAFSVLGLAVGTALPANAVLLPFPTPNPNDIEIDFNDDLSFPPAAQGVPNGFQSNDSSLVSFSDFDVNLQQDDPGANLQVGFFPELPGNFTSPTNVGLNQAFADTGAIAFTFSQSVQSLQFDFGNDDTIMTGDGGLLTLFSGGPNGTQVGQVFEVATDDPLIPPNTVGAVDQSIAVSGVDFDFATFVFARPNAPVNPTSFTAINGSELIDNVAFELSQQPIPFEAEGTMGLAVLGGYFWYRNRRKRNQASS